jgi:hypothetical protein
VFYRIYQIIKSCSYQKSAASTKQRGYMLTRKQSVEENDLGIGADLEAFMQKLTASRTRQALTACRPQLSAHCWHNSTRVAHD